MPNVDDLTPAQMRRLGPAQNMWEHQQDMADSARLQASLQAPTGYSFPPQQPQNVALTPAQQELIRQLASGR